MTEERLGLVVCPTHEGGWWVKIIDDQNVLHEYHVVRLVWKIGDKVHNFRYPPIEFSFTVIEHFFDNFPDVHIMIGEEKCAECQGFDFPTFVRKKWTP